MRRLAVASLALATLAAAPLRAQNPNCAGASAQTADACEKATDLFGYMMPQLGTSLVGGSHTLGLGATLGGFGRFAIALRGNAVMGDLPDVDGISISPTGRQSSNIATNAQVLGLPGVDFAAGLFRGIPLGVNRIGSIDLIGNLTYVPEIEDDGLSLSPTDGSLKVGLGGRVGLLEQSLVVPAVSFSYMVRDVPTLDLAATAGDDEIALRSFSVKTQSWRLAAQKNFTVFQFAFGVGQDTYDSEAGLDVTVNDGVIPGGSASFTTDLSQSLTRTTYYGSLGFNLFLAKVVAEVGQVQGGTVTTYNTFDEAADKSRLYGSLGIRISF